MYKTYASLRFGLYFIFRSFFVPPIVLLWLSCFKDCFFIVLRCKHFFLYSVIWMSKFKLGGIFKSTNLIEASAQTKFFTGLFLCQENIRIVTVKISISIRLLMKSAHHKLQYSFSLLRCHKLLKMLCRFLAPNIKKIDFKEHHSL